MFLMIVLAGIMLMILSGIAILQGQYQVLLVNLGGQGCSGE